ncbi:MAG TPA: hypothetical protein VII06_25255 [Chloroflexota bacterium]|jgi:hypothetical protein
MAQALRPPPDEAPPDERPPADAAVRDLIVRRPGGARYWVAVAVCGLLALGGVAGLVVLALGGAEPRAKWGYAAGTLAFLLSTAQAAPTLAFVSRLGRGFWGIPLRRTADLLALAGLVSAPLMILLLWQLPDWRGRPSIWLDWPGAPLLWDSIAIVLLAVLGLALVWAVARPDRAVARDLARRDGGPAGRWWGSLRQWAVQNAGIVALGALYAVLFVFVNLLVSSDLAMSLVPAWASPNIPPYHAVSAFQGGIAVVIVVAAALRHFGGLGAYLPRYAFHAAAKLLFSLSLLFFYFTWAEFLTYWYGRTPDELWLLGLLMFGSYAGLFYVSFLLNFVLPLVLLIWNPIRGSIAGATWVAALVLVGNLADRLRMYVAAWQVAGPVGPRPAALPAPRFPDLVDALIVVGLPAAAVLLYLLALRWAPAISLWEYRWDRLLRVEREYLKARVTVIGKPS